MDMMTRAPIIRAGVAAAAAALTACAGPSGPAEIEMRTGAPGSASAASPSSGASGACEGGVTVRPGDTLFAISRRCGVTVDALAAANDLRPPYQLRPGQVLMMSGGPGAPSRTAAAPASSAAPAAAGEYVVRQGDTLFSVARAHGVQPETLARMNSIAAPYTIYPGQRLATPGPRLAEAAPPSAARAGAELQGARESAPAEIRFAWPLEGRILEPFGGGGRGGQRNDGVKIAARLGDPVRAAAAGEVVYAGDEIQGYGELVLIRHSDRWVTAYAHNARLRVREGDQVSQGQVIAEAGESGSAREPQLHFEIRRNVTPVDPLRYLPAR